jgi:hypothetical protein
MAQDCVMRHHGAVVMPFPLRPHQLPDAQFADYFEMGFEPYVFKIFFGQCGGEHEDPRLKVGLVMSPAFAKNLASHLAAQLVSYEMEFGTIVESQALSDRSRGASAGD